MGVSWGCLPLGVVFLANSGGTMSPKLPPGFGSGAGFRYDAAMYRAVTRQIEVTVEPNFVPEQSSVERSRYFWSYTIVITNSGDETVQLKTRHWIITDATGRQQEVKGEGVIGEQPVLAARERYE